VKWQHCLYKGRCISTSVFNPLNLCICFELSEFFVLEQGNGTWEGQLRITRVTPEDVTRKYILKARNEMGEQQYRVSISTSAEPQGTRTYYPSS